MADNDAALKILRDAGIDTNTLANLQHYTVRGFSASAGAVQVDCDSCEYACR